MVQSVKSKKTGREDLLIEPLFSLLRLHRGVNDVQLFWEPPHKRRKGEENKKWVLHLVKQVVKAVNRSEEMMIIKNASPPFLSGPLPFLAAGAPVLLWVVVNYCPLEEKPGSASEEDGHMFRNSMIKYYHDSPITSFTSSNCKMLFLGHR